MFRSRDISKAAEIEMYKTKVKPAVMFGSETWAVTEMDRKRLGTWERQILSRIHGLVVGQGISRIRTEHELREIYKDLDIVADTERRD